MRKLLLVAIILLLMTPASIVSAEGSDTNTGDRVSSDDIMISENGAVTIEGTDIGSDNVISAEGSGANQNSIVLDGSFSDWSDKPYVDDPKHDIKVTWFDFLRVGYFADDRYLYLYVQRLSAEKSEPWRFSVVMINAVQGEKKPQYPNGTEQPIYAPQFDIVSDYLDFRSDDGITVDVYFEGQKRESTFSAENNNKEIEFRIPLADVGLDGLNKEIQFMLKSDVDTDTGVIDWVPDGGIITVTTGPTFYELTTVVFFLGVSYAAYRTYRRRNQGKKA